MVYPVIKDMSGELASILHLPLMIRNAEVSHLETLMTNFHSFIIKVCSEKPWKGCELVREMIGCRGATCTSLVTCR